VRRVQPDSALPERIAPSSAGRRSAPGMPPKFVDPDGDGVLRPPADRFAAPQRSWWRPSSQAGRVGLAISALVVLGALAYGGWTVKRFLQQDTRFRIAGADNIQAEGISEVSRTELLPVFGEDIGRNVFFVPLSERRRQLEQIPWVERATVMRVLPDRIRVDVVERKPVAFTRQGQQIGLIDADGVMLTMAPKTMAERHYSFPVLTGIAVSDTAESRKKRMALYQRMIAALDAGGQHNSEAISEVDLSDSEDACVVMPELGADILVHLGAEHFRERFENYKSQIASLRQQYPKLRGVDLRFTHPGQPDQPVILQMANDSEAATSPAPATNTAAAEPEPAAPAKEPEAAKPAVKEVPAAKPAAKEAAAAKHAVKENAAQKHGAKEKSAAKKTKPAAEKKRAAAKHVAAKPAAKAEKRNAKPAARPAAQRNTSRPPETAAPASHSRFTVTPASAVAGGG